MSGLAVVILAGGEGRRIGGSKPLQMLAKQRLLDRAVEQVRRWSDAPALAVRSHEQVGPTTLPLLVDDPSTPGPIAALFSARTFARSAAADLVLTVPCDMPFLPDDLPDRLRAALQRGGKAALAASRGHIHPVCALWRASALDELEAYVASGGSSLRGYASVVGLIEEEWRDDSFDPFFNINTEADIAAAEARLKSATNR